MVIILVPSRNHFIFSVLLTFFLKYNFLLLFSVLRTILHNDYVGKKVALRQFTLIESIQNRDTDLD